MELLGEILNNKKSLISRRINGFTKVPNVLIASTLNIYEKMVWIVIQKHKMNKNECWPSLKKIAKESSCSVSTVKKTIKSLEKRGLVLRIIDKKRRSNVYQSTANINRLPGGQVSSQEMTTTWSPDDHE